MLNIIVRSRPGDMRNQLAIFTLCYQGGVRRVGWQSGSKLGWCWGGSVVIVTPGCSQRPTASCGRVAMEMAGCSVGVLLW